MKLVNEKGGYSIAVYRKSVNGAKTTALKLVQDERADLVATADYSPNSEIENVVTSIFKRMAATHDINSVKLKQEKEIERIYNKQNK